MRTELFVHAHAGVRDRQHGVISGREIQLPAGGLIHGLPEGFNGQRSTRRHGVAGVHHQIHQHLMHLRGVGHDVTRVGGQVLNDADVLGNEPAAESNDLRHHAIQRDGLPHRDLLPAEREQLLG